MGDIAVHQPGFTYAYRLKLSLPPGSTPCPVSAGARVSKPCVIVYPTTERSTDYATSSTKKQTLMKAIKPSDEDFQILGVKKTEGRHRVSSCK